MPASERYEESAWRRCAAAFLLFFIGGLVAVAVLIVVVDPYDSGRLLALLPPGISDDSPRSANASRVRDPNFNAAIFGNSHIQILQPGRLDRLTGAHFVQLSVPGTGPREQAALLRRFMQMHTHVEAVVLGADHVWCSPDPKMSLANPFPFWLYRGNAEFLLNHLHSRVIALSWRRVRVAMGIIPRTDPAGFQDYEHLKTWTFRRELPNAPHVDLSPAPSGGRKFPAIDLVAAELARMPPEVPVVVVMPPRYRSALPDPGSEAAAQIAACKGAWTAHLATRPNSAFVDFYLDTPASRDPENFMDVTHYRGRLARSVENRIAAVLRPIRRAAISAQ